MVSSVDLLLLSAKISTSQDDENSVHYIVMKTNELLRKSLEITKEQMVRRHVCLRWRHGKRWIGSKIQNSRFAIKDKRLIKSGVWFIYFFGIEPIHRSQMFYYFFCCITVKSNFVVKIIRSNINRYKCILW